MTAEFDPSTQHDAYREALLALIESKAAGKATARPHPIEEPAGLTDLMSVLEASVAAARAAREAAVPAQDGEEQAPSPVRRRKSA